MHHNYPILNVMGVVEKRYTAVVTYEKDKEEVFKYADVPASHA